MSPPPAGGDRADEVLALLDDSLTGGSRLYTGFERVHRCDDPDLLTQTWQAVQADQAAGWHAVLLADYEWGVRLQGAAVAPGGPGQAGALRVLMFRELKPLDLAQTEAWLRAQDGEHPGPVATLGLKPGVDPPGFSLAMDAIRAAIVRGETYQVNYTYRLDGWLLGSPLSLYRRLRARQPVAYGAYIALPAQAEPDAPTHVLSLSPELFLRHQDGLLSAKPMKGTAARPEAPADLALAAQTLREDTKNRAENLMIVDLLRNDLGRVAHTGSVQVPALFDIETFATVLQMTSTVTARVRPEVDLPALLRATFPCGSITGAPKRHTLDLITALEATPRGLYCGALGWVDPPAPGAGLALGDACLSVPIRTLTLGPAAADGARALRLGVGAGIVWDSQADAEWAECALKTRFLTDIDPGLTLFETLHVLPGQPPRLAQREQHLSRLARSAQVLGWRCEPAQHLALDHALAVLASGAPSAQGWRLRLDLDWRGRASVRHAPLAPLALTTDGHALLCLSERRLPNRQPLAAHKTSWRAHYDTAAALAEQQGAFDMVFATQDGRLTEGARSNLLLRLEGCWWTPPVSDGALPGIARAQLLQHGWQGQPVRERTLWLADLARAEAVAVCNALRGVLPARWLHSPPTSRGE
jgi:para-aminobenzoate synthetase/4-amino-4-deoxychorismate lyase